MPKGGCACGNVRLNYTGEPSAKVCLSCSSSSSYVPICPPTQTKPPNPCPTQALCHCTDCKKITGSAYSTNIVIPSAGFEITSGKPKSWKKQADSGESIETFFCGDCGTTMWRETPTFGDNKAFKVGVLDTLDGFNGAKPDLELYAPQRASWVKPVEGAKQLKGMPGSEEV
jgi:hypothetical protein